MRRRRSPVCCSYRRLVAHAVMEKKGFRANGSERFSLHMRVSLQGGLKDFRLDSSDFP